MAEDKQATLYRMVLPDHECPFGRRAKEMLEAAGYDIDEHLLETREQVEAEGVPAAQVPHRTFAGNHPTTTILAERLTPYALGQLVAIYEHRVLTQGTVWQIDSFDQWGVELGKALAQRIAAEIASTSEAELAHDSSTNALIRKYRNAR